MTQQVGWVVPGHVWGFCPTCERWRYSDAWLDGTSTGEPGCPVCGGTPSALEEIVDGRGRIRLVLELPPGLDFPLDG